MGQEDLHGFSLKIIQVIIKKKKLDGITILSSKGSYATEVIAEIIH